MTFTRVSDYAERSDCTRYTVCFSRSGTRTFFQAFRVGRDRFSAPELIKTFVGRKRAAALARKACRDHLAQEAAA
jgi:hypothetical protein